MQLKQREGILILSSNKLCIHLAKEKVKIK